MLNIIEFISKNHCSLGNFSVLLNVIYVACWSFLGCGGDEKYCVVNWVEKNLEEKSLTWYFRKR